MKKRILDYFLILLIAWGVPALMAATGNPVLVAVDLEDDDWIGDSTGAYIVFDDTDDEMRMMGDIYLNEATATRLLYTDASKQAQSVGDLTDWLGSGAGSLVTDDGDGTVTIEIDQQLAEADAETTHNITDPGDSPADADALRDDLVANTIVDAEFHMDELGTKINNIIAKLEAAGILAP